MPLGDVWIIFWLKVSPPSVETAWKAAFLHVVAELGDLGLAEEGEDRPVAAHGQGGLGQRLGQAAGDVRARRESSRRQPGKA